MFEYQRRAEARKPTAALRDRARRAPARLHGLARLSAGRVGKFEVVGGLLGEPLEVAPCATIDLHVPAAAEIVIEGEILPGVREPEGPFGEFTGYFSRRSTEHVFVAKAIAMRERPWFQSIGSGRAGDHITTLGLVREAEIHNALSRVIPNVTGVHVPLSGTSSFTAYVAIKQSRPGEAKHVIPIVLGVDHYLKLVIVVDDDVDVFDEADVLWAVATRMQADRDLVMIAGSLGAMLDPSAHSGSAPCRKPRLSRIAARILPPHLFGPYRPDGTMQISACSARVESIRGGRWISWRPRAESPSSWSRSSAGLGMTWRRTGTDQSLLRFGWRSSPLFRVSQAVDGETRSYLGRGEVPPVRRAVHLRREPARGSLDLPDDAPPLADPLLRAGDRASLSRAACASRRCPETMRTGRVAHGGPRRRQGLRPVSAQRRGLR